MISLVEKLHIPSWLEYPTEYLNLVNSGRDEFLPWYLFDKDQLMVRYVGLQKRYPTRELFPFARDDDSDDVACWEKEKPGKVILIHDFASPGYENKLEFPNFLSWYSYAQTQSTR